jgi:zinc transport system substrate-binding protein
MHKFILLFLISTTYIFSNINAIVSILPQQTFLQAIGGDKVNITLMVQIGNSPHTYEPKPSQMMAVAKADIYFAIDVEFEHVWLPKFQSLNAKMQIIDITKGVEKIHMVQAHHRHEAHAKHDHEGEDPHIWTAPSNVKIIAKNIYTSLAKLDSVNAPYYKKNLDTFLASVNETDKQIKEILSTLKNSRTFMVFHPSWGYFANAYNLTQIAVEVEGKSPKPRELVSLIKEAKEENVNAIFTQPEFSDSSAKIIANELHIPVVKVSPMSPHWSENLINMAKSIAGQK